MTSIIYKNKTYDISSFIESHPGGQLVMSNCDGCDLTEVAQSYHTTSGIIKLENILKNIGARSVVRPRRDNYIFVPTYTDIRDDIYNKKMNSVDSVDLILWISLYIFLFWTSCNNIIDGIIKGVAMIVMAGYGHQYVHVSSVKASFITLAGFNSQIWRYEHVLSHHPYTNTKWDIDLHEFANIDRLLPIWSWLKFMIVSTLIVFRPYVQYLSPWFMKKMTKWDMMAVAFLIYDVIFNFGITWIIKKYIVAVWFLVIDYFNHYYDVKLTRISDIWHEQQVETSCNVVISKWMYEKYPFVHSLLTFGLDRQVEHHLMPRLKMEHLSMVKGFNIKIHYLGWESLVAICTKFVWNY
jgi:hypothetical protein